jgi:APA family basic amino acid/polyamine antiporter
MGLGLVAILIIVAFIHHNTMDEGTNDTGLFYFSLIFAAIHALFYGSRLSKK